MLAQGISSIVLANIATTLYDGLYIKPRQMEEYRRVVERQGQTLDIIGSMNQRDNP